MNRQCVCGEYIPHSWSLCKECLEIYGADRDVWPAWLSFAVSDAQRVINSDRRHDEIAYNDEFAYSCMTIVKGQLCDTDMGWGSYTDDR